MKTELSPIPYPTTKAEEYKWGFDIYRPEGVPMAWIMDWTSAGAGYGVSSQRTMEVLRFKVGVDLSQISVDEMAAALSMRLKLQWHGFWKTLEDKFGAAKAVEVGREMSHPNGRTMWKRIQNNFGTPVPLDKIIWYQDVTHLLSGPTMRAYSWCDERKSVCTRVECAMRPPKGMEECARYCRVCDDASIEGYMAVDPDLFCVRVPDLGDRAEEPRCVHMWTYDKKVVESLPDVLKERIPETTRKVLNGKGVRL